MGLEFCFYWGQEWRFRLSWAYSLLVNLKIRSRKLNHNKEKQNKRKQDVQITGTQNKQDSYQKTIKNSKINELGGVRWTEPGLSSSLKASNVFEVGVLGSKL